MIKGGDDPSSMEPVARLVRAKLDALGWKYTEERTVKATGLTRSNLSDVTTRREPYPADSPIKTKTLAGLEKIPGMGKEELAAAVAESTGAVVKTAAPPGSPARRSVLKVVNDLPEEVLPSVLQLLVYLADMLRDRGKGER